MHLIQWFNLVPNFVWGVGRRRIFIHQRQGLDHMHVASQQDNQTLYELPPWSAYIRFSSLGDSTWCAPSWMDCSGLWAGEHRGWPKVQQQTCSLSHLLHVLECKTKPPNGGLVTRCSSLNYVKSLNTLATLMIYRNTLVTSFPLHSLNYTSDFGSDFGGIAICT